MSRVRPTSSKAAAEMKNEDVTRDQTTQAVELERLLLRTEPVGKAAGSFSWLSTG